MTFKKWLHYFEENQNHFDHIKWSNCDRLSKTEINVITSSIQQFQRGENSEGKNLIKYAKAYEQEYYLQTIKLFIKEEQKHALILGRFMSLNEISTIKEHWVDNVFRQLRKLAHLENSILFLITAEVIAAIYYQALANATKSKTLKLICKQILKDEEMHINFQSFTLSQLYLKRNALSRLYIRWFHKFFMFGTTIVVWFSHRKVLHQGGYNFALFFNKTFAEFNRSEQMIKGQQNSNIKIPIIDNLL